jgi:hypothetical protein
MSFDFGLLCKRVLFVGVFLILLFDLFLAAFGGPGTTISLVLFNLTGGDLMSFQERTLLLGVGYVVGHIFGRIDTAGRMRSPYPRPWKLGYWWNS